MSDENALRMWVIYDHPKDYPNDFVIRCWLVLPHGLLPASNVRTAPSLAEVRKLLPPDADSRIPRAPGDDPCIVESWV